MGVACGLVKTTLYVPEGLKRRLEHAASESGRSEAEIGRWGIEMAIVASDALKPRSGIFDSGDSYFAERADELLHGFGEG